MVRPLKLLAVTYCDFLLILFLFLSVTLRHCAIDNNCFVCMLQSNLYFQRIFIAFSTTSDIFTKIQSEEQLPQFRLILVQIRERNNEKFRDDVFY